MKSPQSLARSGKRRIASAAMIVTLYALLAPAVGNADDAPAKLQFGSKALPADLPPRSEGFYSKGCLAGGMAIPADGPTWQVMRLSRNRRWGHPDLIRLLEELSIRARSDGWSGLMIGDLSQPRGGPMLTGHLSHQIGLDADLWFMPMPDKRLDYREREEMSAVSVLRDGSDHVDDARWTPAHTRLLQHAANFDQVQRILVHPGVKKKLCDTVEGDRGWLAKIRPYYGHHHHFHIRLRCPGDSPGCRPQKAVGKASGCDKSLKWWFDHALKPKKPDPTVKPKKRRELALGDLPDACRRVLSADELALRRAEFRIKTSGFTAPEIELPEFDHISVLASKPIEGSQEKIRRPTIPVPTPRPGR